MHWVTFAVVRTEPQTAPTVLYKDSQGGSNNVLQEQLRNINPNIQFISNSKAEQSRGVDCGIFALENTAIIAEQLGQDTRSFINSFANYANFCSLDKAQDMRENILPTYYAKEVKERLENEPLNQIKRTKIETHHNLEIEAIKSRLQQHQGGNIAVEIEQDRPIAEIIASNDYNYYYAFNLKNTNLSDQQAKQIIDNALATNVQDRHIDGRKIKIHPSSIGTIHKQNKLVPSQIYVEGVNKNV
jgi:hypothetical protein